MSKRKRVVLSLEDKINIIDSLKKGETRRKLAIEYGIGTSTISDIKRNTNLIMLYSCKLENEGGRSTHRKIMKKPNNELLEDALYCWFLEKRSTGQTISGPLICKKALQLNKKLGGHESFVASNGWLHRFKLRHGIREQGEKTPVTVDEDNTFKANFNNDSDYVCNVDDTDLNWKGENLELQIDKQQKEYEMAENLEVNNAGPSHDEAVQALDTVLKWFEIQKECDNTSLLQLKRIRDVAATKRKSGLRQMTITKYFKPI